MAGDLPARSARSASGAASGARHRQNGRAARASALQQRKRLGRGLCAVAFSRAEVSASRSLALPWIEKGVAHETGHCFLAPLADFFHHWAAARRHYLPDIASDPDWLDSCGHLGRLCPEPVEYRPKDPSGARASVSAILPLPDQTTYSSS